MKLCLDSLDTPIGHIWLVGDERALRSLDFDADPDALAARHAPYALEPRPGFGGFRERLSSYFGGDLQALDDIPTSPAGTAFQLRVWQALRTIPAGATISYLELAARVGRPTASRAVGAANGRNPIALVAPCHRVIGSNGGLTGYAGGLERKRWLLRHEGRLI